MKNIIKIEKQRQEIQKHLNKYHSIRKASRDFNICRKALHKQFDTQWDAKKDTQCIYEKDRTTLDVIDTQDKAYSLGLLIADGSIDKKGRIKIEVKDKELCEYIKQVFKSKAPVKKKTRIRKEFKVKEQTSFNFSVSSVEYVSTGAQWGLIPNKTYSDDLRVPDILEGLKPHFVRGYFDGDGSVFNIPSGKMIGFTGNKSMMYSIKEYLNSLNIACNPKVKQDGSSGSWKFYFGAQQDVRLFYDLIYKDANLFLKRKYHKFEL